MKTHLPILLGLLLLLAGCSTLQREAPRPGRTTLGSPLVLVPATTIGNYLIVEARWDRHGPYRFLVDTGSSTTIVTAELAARYPAKNVPPEALPRVRVRSASGETTVLPSTTLRRLELGAARFEDVQVLVHDFKELSNHLGVKIDGLLGFPLFRETVLTLDYPKSRLLLQPRHPAPLHPGAIIPFNNERRIPFITLALGDQPFTALIDSGSDAPLTLNLAGLATDFEILPRPGTLIGTLTGDHLQHVGRWRAPLEIGEYQIPRPIVDVTDAFSSLGGGILRHFTVTFDQERNRVTFHRETHSQVVLPPKRSSGLSFSKLPAYWRVLSVVPNSPAERAGVQTGDLVSRIDYQPVAEWNFTRFEQLVASARDINFSFLQGNQVVVRTIPVFELVP